MPDFTLRQLECFVAVADAATIAAAAEQLHASPSAVGAAIEELERHLGERLTVRRRAHGVTLTSAGSALLPRARALLTAAADLQPAADGALAGSLVVGCYETLAPSLLPRIVEGFEAEHPAVRVRLAEGSQYELLDGLESGLIDAAILYERDLRGDLDTIVLYRLPAHVLLPADHRLAGADRVRLADLAEEPFIQYNVEPAWQNTQALFTATGVRPNVRYVTGNYELARSLVGRGLGYTVLVQRQATDRTYEGGRVAVCEIDPQPQPTTIVLAWPRETGRSRLLRTLVGWAPGQVQKWRTGVRG
ncbi:LysR substrate-binding domain-containing protein [Enemella evansiae]|uniref:LysR substrate-binding domain-containing protein n=1 Tax=Enemella evansiae TaxID=2016499 RepID=UPI000B9651D2|nr:LysR substrate-binding domain-containing protein [Enemella evansiae]OYO12122.1 LysR family transcriptional regulator [Enemella evansiae]OYO14129.1 LysR family transcriptional regulator [Enemella evansiae]TDO89431.1 LysR family transcriptional regulator [Enemella evansiae]